MNLKLKLNEAQMQREMATNLKNARLLVEAAMARRFLQITLLNLGNAGIDRPRPWKPLSPWYAKKVGRKIATLILTGKLKSAIHIEDGNKVVVKNEDVSYATDHQYGNAKKHLPARPYFPIKSDGTPTPWTADELRIKAQETINSIFS